MEELKRRVEEKKRGRPGSNKSAKIKEEKFKSREMLPSDSDSDSDKNIIPKKEKMS